MNDAEWKQELTALKAQVEALSLKRPGAGASSGDERPKQKSEAGAPESDFLKGLERLTEGSEMGPLRDKLAGYVTDLAKDVKGSEPRALVASFLAGVLVGKLLSR